MPVIIQCVSRRQELGGDRAIACRVEGDRNGSDRIREVAFELLMDWGMWNSVFAQLETYMDLTAARQKLVATNIANASTPGYRTKDIDFHSEYRRSLDGAAATPRVVQPEGLAAGNDGNDVSLEREARLLAENAMRFNAASQLWRSGLRQVRLAIGTGRNG